MKTSTKLFILIPLTMGSMLYFDGTIGVPIAGMLSILLCIVALAVESKESKNAFELELEGLLQEQENLKNLSDYDLIKKYTEISNGAMYKNDMFMYEMARRFLEKSTEQKHPNA